MNWLFYDDICINTSHISKIEKSFSSIIFYSGTQVLLTCDYPTQDECDSVYEKIKEYLKEINDLPAKFV